MVKKIIKRISLIMFATIALTVTNCFATNIISEEFKTKKIKNFLQIKKDFKK